MQEAWSRHKTQIVLGAIAFILVLYTYPQSGTVGVATLTQTPTVLSAERLLIPSIGVNAPIELVGRTTSGAMDTPNGPTNVGLYSLGPRPGEEGNAVIAGHRGWKDGKPAVFDDLGSVQVGDTIVVIDSQGMKRTFIVRDTKLYERDSIVPEVFISDAGIHLNLITCFGEWNSELQSSKERLVVFSDLVNDY